MNGHLNIISRCVKKKVSILVMAFMLGMSNVILEETLMVNDTRVKTEQQEVFTDDGDFVGNGYYFY